MKNSCPLLSTLFSKNDKSFLSSFADLLLSREFKSFTIWDVVHGSLCKPADGHRGVTEGTFDVYDLGYSGGESFLGEFSLRYFDMDYAIKAAIFCIVAGEIKYAVTFHEPVSENAFIWLKALLPFLTAHVGDLHADERRMELFIDYQKKIDFIKNSGQILKVLDVNDVIVNALNFFSETFHSEACCAVYGDFFVGFGMAEEDLKKAIFMKGVPLSEYLRLHTEIEFIDQDLSSPKFSITNIFVVRDELSGALFLFFNIIVDKVPDKDFSQLISHILAIAVENASYHERMTKFKVEEAEMSQTVKILNQFVMQEYKHDGPPQIFSVNYPAKSTGGDFFTIIDKGEFIFICVADVCGKGYSAAVFTVMLAAVMESGLCPDIKNIGPLVNGINSYLLNRQFNERFITGFFCTYNKTDRKLTYISCGHEPVFLIKKDGTSENLISSNLPLGILDEDYYLQDITADAEDLMFIYTDGVIEYISYEALEKKLTDFRADTPQDIVTTLYKELVTNPGEQRDDFTCVAIKF